MLPIIYIVKPMEMEVLRKWVKHALWWGNRNECIVISAYNDYVVDDMINNETTAHYHISFDGVVTAFSLDSNVLNHCPHTYKNWENMNYVSIWIILEKRRWRYSKEQRLELKKLTRKLTKKYSIPKEKIFTIDDIDEELTYVGGNLARGYNDWEEYQCSLHHSAEQLNLNEHKWNQYKITHTERNVKSYLKDIRVLNFEDNDEIDPRIYTLIDRAIRYGKGLPLYE